MAPGREVVDQAEPPFRPKKRLTCGLVHSLGPLPMAAWPRRRGAIDPSGVPTMSLTSKIVTEFACGAPLPAARAAGRPARAGGLDDGARHHRGAEGWRHRQRRHLVAGLDPARRRRRAALRRAGALSRRRSRRAPHRRPSRRARHRIAPSLIARSSGRPRPRPRPLLFEGELADSLAELLRRPRLAPRPGLG